MYYTKRDAAVILAAESVLVALFFVCLHLGKLELWAWPTLIVLVETELEKLLRAWWAQRHTPADAPELDLADWEDELFTVERAGHLFSKD